MFKKILAGIVVVMLVLVAVVAMQPADFRISRSAAMAAPVSTVFAHVNDFHRWESWSPWAKLDPAMQQTFSGAATGTNAVYAWAGNDQVGEGRMTIEETRADEFIRITLEFLKPFPASNTTEFAFKAEGAQTVVTWSMIGRNNFTAKAFGLLIDMDKLVGGDFEKGLAQMKAVVEAAPTDPLAAQ